MYKKNNGQTSCVVPAKADACEASFRERYSLVGASYRESLQSLCDGCLYGGTLTTNIGGGFVYGPARPSPCLPFLSVPAASTLLLNAKQPVVSYRS